MIGLTRGYVPSKPSKRNAQLAEAVMLHFNSAAAYPSNAVRLEPNLIPGLLGSDQGERHIAVHCNRSIFCVASPLWPL